MATIASLGIYDVYVCLCVSKYHQNWGHIPTASSLFFGTSSGHPEGPCKERPGQPMARSWNCSPKDAGMTGGEANSESIHCDGSVSVELTAPIALSWQAIPSLYPNRSLKKNYFKHFLLLVQNVSRGFGWFWKLAGE